MRHNKFLDTPIAGSPFHTVRAFLWNVRTLGFGWWLWCLTQNVVVFVLECTGQLAAVSYVHDRHNCGSMSVTLGGPNREHSI